MFDIKIKIHYSREKIYRFFRSSVTTSLYCSFIAIVDKRIHNTAILYAKDWKDVTCLCLVFRKNEKLSLYPRENWLLFIDYLLTNYGGMSLSK